MQRRALPLALTVLGALLVWLWLLERAPEPDPTPAPMAAPLWAPFEAGAIQSITIQDKGVVLLERQADGWRVTLPDDRPRRAASVRADAAASGLAGLESLRTIDGDPASFGLGPDALRVTIGLADDERVLRIGDAVTVGQGRYVAVGAQVHIVPAGPLAAVLADPLGWRDRRLLPVDAEAVLAIESGLTDPPLALERRGSSWFLEPGPGMRADENAAAVLVDELVGLEAVRWRPTDAPLDGPTVQVRTDAGTISLTFAPLPADGPTLDVHVTGPGTDSADSVATVDLQDLAGLLAPAGDWPSDELVALNPWLVRSFTWSAGGSSWTFDHTDAGWLGPGDAGARDRVATAAVHDFLQTVDGLRGEGWLPADDAPLGLVETAGITGTHADGSTFTLTLLRGPSHDYGRSGDEDGLREVDDGPDALLGALHPLVEAAP